MPDPSPVPLEVASWLQSIWELKDSPDRICAIVWGAIIQDALKSLLVSKLVLKTRHAKKLTEFGGPLGNFGLMNDLAYTIDLIGNDIWSDLDCVRKIRNKFAHWTTQVDSKGEVKSVTFSTESIRHLSENLRCPERVLRLDLRNETIEPLIKSGFPIDIPTLPIPTAPRERFEWTCECLRMVAKGMMTSEFQVQSSHSKEYPSAWQPMRYPTNL